VLSIPVHPSLTDDDLKVIVDAVSTTASELAAERYRKLETR